MISMLPTPAGFGHGSPLAIALVLALALGGCLGAAPLGSDDLEDTDRGPSIVSPRVLDQDALRPGTTGATGFVVTTEDVGFVPWGVEVTVVPSEDGAISARASMDLVDEPVTTSPEERRSGCLFLGNGHDMGSVILPSMEQVTHSSAAGNISVGQEGFTGISVSALPSRINATEPAKFVVAGTGPKVDGEQLVLEGSFPPARIKDVRVVPRISCITDLNQFAGEVNKVMGTVVATDLSYGFVASEGTYMKVMIGADIEYEVVVKGPDGTLWEAGSGSSSNWVCQEFLSTTPGPFTVEVPTLRAATGHIVGIMAAEVSETIASQWLAEQGPTRSCWGDERGRLAPFSPSPFDR